MPTFLYVTQILCLSGFLVFLAIMSNKRAKELSEELHNLEHERQRQFHEMEHQLWKSLEVHRKRVVELEEEMQRELDAIRRDLPSIPN